MARHGGRDEVTVPMRSPDRTASAAVGSTRAPATSPVSPNSDEALRLLGLLWALDHALEVHSKRTAREVGVTGPQRFALRAIHRRPGLSASDLAGVLHLDKSTLTGVLRRLEGRGLVERRLDPADARRRQLRLSVAGRRLATRRLGSIEDVVRQALRGVPSRDLGAACRVLARLGQRLAGARGAVRARALAPGSSIGR